MPFSPIRSRFAVLLLWAALALVTNPVLHAFSHDHHDDLADITERVVDAHWAEQELCPYCDAVSQVVAPPLTEASIVPVAFPERIEPVASLYLDLRLRVSARLRAPPFLV
ncbi:MAG: hypothetical protein AAF564_16255 [Bacteroidota bacterium]